MYLLFGMFVAVKILPSHVSSTSNSWASLYFEGLESSTIAQHVLVNIPLLTSTLHSIGCWALVLFKFEWYKLWSLSKKRRMCFEISYECVLNIFPHIELECKYCVSKCYNICIEQSFPHKLFISSNTLHPQKCSNVEYMWNWRECGVCSILLKENEQEIVVHKSYATHYWR